MLIMLLALTGVLVVMAILAFTVPRAERLAVRRNARALIAQRPSADPDQLREELANSRVPAPTIEAVYRALQQIMHVHGVADFPVSASDDLQTVYAIYPPGQGGELPALDATAVLRLAAEDLGIAPPALDRSAHDELSAVSDVRALVRWIHLKLQPASQGPVEWR
jgi:hypothetical protein